MHYPIMFWECMVTQLYAWFMCGEDPSIKAELYISVRIEASVLSAYMRCSTCSPVVVIQLSMLKSLGGLFDVV